MLCYKYFRKQCSELLVSLPYPDKISLKKSALLHYEVKMHKILSKNLIGWQELSMFFVGLTSVNTVYCSSALHRSLNGSAHVISRPFAGLSTLLRLSATTHPRGKMPILPEAVIICKLCQTFISYDMCGLRTREFSIGCFFHLPFYLLTIAFGLNAFTFSVGPAPPDLFRFPLSVLAFRRLPL